MHTQFFPRMVTISHTDCLKTGSLRKVQVVSPASSYLKLGKWFLQCWFFESGPSSWHQNWGPHICMLILCLVDGRVICFSSSKKVPMPYCTNCTNCAPKAKSGPYHLGFSNGETKKTIDGEIMADPWAMQICKNRPGLQSPNLLRLEVEPTRPTSGGNW